MRRGSDLSTKGKTHAAESPIPRFVILTVALCHDECWRQLSLAPFLLCRLVCWSFSLKKCAPRWGGSHCELEIMSSNMFSRWPVIRTQCSRTMSRIKRLTVSTSTWLYGLQHDRTIISSDPLRTRLGCGPSLLRHQPPDSSPIVSRLSLKSRSCLEVHRGRPLLLQPPRFTVGARSVSGMTRRGSRNWGRRCRDPYCRTRYAFVPLVPLSPRLTILRTGGQAIATNIYANTSNIYVNTSNAWPDQATVSATSLK